MRIKIRVTTLFSVGSFSKISFFLLLFLLFNNCRSQNKNNYRSLLDLIDHFKDSGLRIETIQPLLPLPVKAQEGVALSIAGRQIGVYKFNKNIKRQKEKIEKISDEGYVYIVGRKYPVKINGSFVMIDYADNPKKEEIVKAFESFN